MRALCVCRITPLPSPQGGGVFVLPAPEFRYPKSAFRDTISEMIFSIDQNSNSLWDTLPKLQALRTAGAAVRHILEDIDVAFTFLGSPVGSDDEMRIAPERFYPSGGQDWGAALFYNEFLGRQCVDLRRWTPMLGVSPAEAARRMDLTTEELYRRYAVGDNWMLIGSSYVGDREHHRLLGDLTVEAVAPFVREILARAEADCRKKFPAEESRRRTQAWFQAERNRLERLLADRPGAALADLYGRWLREFFGEDMPMLPASEVFALGQSPDRDALLELFLRDYETAAELYNQAVRETGVGVHELDVRRGEAPFFAFGCRQGRAVRVAVRIVPGSIVAGEEDFVASDGRVPVEALRAAGVKGLAGKAVVLALQARLPPAGGALALPHGGSVYMPACHRFAALLQARRLLPAPPAPVLRVRFRLLDRLRSLDTPLRLPEYLAEVFGEEVLPARRLGEQWADVAAEAKQRLAELADPVRRLAYQRAAWPKEMRTMEELEREKRRLAAENSRDRRVWELGQAVRKWQNELLARTLRQIARDWQTAQLEFYDSRGALLPWCVALGGEAFYREVISRAEIREENVGNS